MSPLERFAAAILCAALSAGALAAPARAERWTFTGSAGASLGYQLQGHSYDPEFGPSWLVRAGARRLVGNRWALLFTAGDLHYSRDEALASIPEITVREARQTVDFVPISAGARLYYPPGFGGARSARGFLELAPTFCVATWRERRAWDDHLTVPGKHVERSTRVTRGLAALSLGWGIEWSLKSRVRPEFAVRYLFSGSPVRLHEANAGLWEVNGLRQLSIELGLGWAP
jgi:hypothetical protein